MTKPNLTKLLRALAVGLAHHLQLATGLAQGTAYTTLTITNPAPSADDQFGSVVAAFGSNLALIGAPNASRAAAHNGAAYLFSANGALVTTFTDPVPAGSNYFGISVAALVPDRVVIGAYYADTGAIDTGVAYLFSTNGALITTFTDPAPAASNYFGIRVAALGTGQVVVAAYYADTGATDAGVAYLFNTNGALLTTFVNPTPTFGDWFGFSVAAVGSDRVLITAPGDNTGAPRAGSAYLFNTDGVLLTTYNNPTPAVVDYFGVTLATMGADRVLIGAYLDDTGAVDAGAVYLFSINGALLTTFTNPTPSALDYFGVSVAAVGTDRVLIGAFDDTGATDAGAAYLFSTNGALLTTFTNPAPTVNDFFGRSAAAVGTDRMLIGAHNDDAGAPNAGVVYLFTPVQTPVPLSLTIRPTVTNTMAVSWPSSSANWALQQNTNSVTSPNWSNVTSGIQINGATKTLIVDPPSGNRFYRLYNP